MNVLHVSHIVYYRIIVILGYSPLVSSLTEAKVQVAKNSLASRMCDFDSGSVVSLGPSRSSYAAWFFCPFVNSWFLYNDAIENLNKQVCVGPTMLVVREMLYPLIFRYVFVSTINWLHTCQPVSECLVNPLRKRAVPVNQLPMVPALNTLVCLLFSIFASGAEWPIVFKSVLWGRILTLSILESFLISVLSHQPTTWTVSE